MIMRYKPTDGVFNIRVLKYLSSSSIIPSDLFYAAVETMDLKALMLKDLQFRIVSAHCIMEKWLSRSYIH